MGHSIGAAHDPSVADYRATSPASPGRKPRSSGVEDVSTPKLSPEAKRKAIAELTSRR